MDPTGSRLLSTGHRTRKAKSVISACVDLLILQRSKSKMISRSAMALLSLLVRETADLRKRQKQWEDATGAERTKSEQAEAARRFAVARKKLGLQPKEEPDRPSPYERLRMAESIELAGKLDDEYAKTQE